MTDRSQMSRRYPPEFTGLIVEVVDTALKAVIQPDPIQYIQNHAVLGAQEIKQLRHRLPPAQRHAPGVLMALKCDLIRNRTVRDLAIDLVEAFERIEQARHVDSENTVAILPRRGFPNEPEAVPSPFRA